MDGVLLQIAQLPGSMQRDTYSGHKRRPGPMWQVITTPDGIIFLMFGPYEGRRHGMHRYSESFFDAILSENLSIDGVQHHMFGDSG
jgi:hypothetical protein